MCSLTNVAKTHFSTCWARKKCY